MKTPTLKVNHLTKVTLMSIFLLSSMDASLAAPSTVADYDAGWIVNTVEKRLEPSSGDVWTTLDGGHGSQEISINNTVGINNRSAQIDVTGYGSDGLFKIYFAYDLDRHTTLDAPDGHNRMSLFVTIPYAGSGSEHHFHIGTYSKNPATAGDSTNLGNHWYHAYDLRGSKGNYWTKMYMDKRPQHRVSSSETISTNPTMPGFDYFDGLTRLYLQMKYSPIESAGAGNFIPYTMYVDEIEFYTETRVENDETINSVAITYHGTGEFDIDWSSFSPYERHYETYEVKYSYSPINTAADYANAVLVPGSPSGGWGEENIGHHENLYRAKFTIPNFDETQTVFFAIKDLYSSHPKELKRVNYHVTNGGTVAVAPLPPGVNPIQ